MQTGSITHAQIRAIEKPHAALRIALTLWGCLGVARTSCGAPPYLDRSLDAVLAELERAGHFQLVYSSQLVPANAKVTHEPPAGAPLDVVARLLAPLHLQLQPVDAHTYAIVRTGGEGQPAAAHLTPSTPPSGEALTEVVVTASRYTLVADVPDIHTFLNQGDIETLPRLAEDPLKTVHRLPGAASNGLSGVAHMRGGETDETLVIFDGLPMYEPFHLRLLQSPASVLDERVLAGLDAYAGGFTAEYGDRMSAVIDARSVQPDPDGHYELGLSLVHTNALASHGFDSGRGGWLVSFRRSNLDKIADTFDSELGEPRYVDGFARLDYAWSPATRVSLHLLLASDRVDVTNALETEHAEARYSNTYVWGTLQHDFSERWRLDALASYTDVGSERVATVDEPGTRTGSADDQRDYDVAGLKVDLRRIGDRWLQRAGIDVRSLSARYDYMGTVLYAPDSPVPDAVSFMRDLSPRPSGEHYAAYYTARGRLTDALTAEFGVRWDMQTYAQVYDDQVAPRVNFAWRIDDRTRLLASWGRYQQFQGIEELQVEDGVTDFQRAEHADQAIVGFERALTDDLALRAEAYRKDYADLRTRYENLFDPMSLAPELRWDRVAISPSAARAEGVELSMSLKQHGPWSGWFAYTWSRVDDTVDGARVRRSWDQRHTVNAGISWSNGLWQATLAGQYHTGWPVTPIALDSGGAVVLGPRNVDRYDDFASIDARVSRDWTLARGTLTVHAEVTNALDRKNACCTDFHVEDEEGMPVLERETRHWLPLVPSVGVLWKF
jgi:outer membrane cobalamin receptor